MKAWPDGGYTACLAFEPIAQGDGAIVRVRTLTARRGFGIVQSARAAVAGGRSNWTDPRSTTCAGQGSGRAGGPTRQRNKTA